MTVSMLMDLCNATGFCPAELIGDSKEKKIEEVIEKVSEVREREIRVIKIQENFEKKYLTCDDVAARYGVKKNTVWFWIRENKLNAIQFGRSYRIKLEDLIDFEDTRSTKK